MMVSVSLICSGVSGPTLLKSKEAPPKAPATMLKDEVAPPFSGSACTRRRDFSLSRHRQ